MFKSPRWMTERKINKFTALFKLRFHATQVSQYGENALVLSLVPFDTGKPTAKLEKTFIREDCCFWENSLFERIKFAQDQKTGKIHEKSYHFILSIASSSKNTVVGEVSVNIADYAEATKPTSISLPFNTSESAGPVLHISVQRIQETAANERELEDEIIRMKSEDRSLKRHFSNGDAEKNTDTNPKEEEEPFRKTVSNTTDLNGGVPRASIGSDITLSSSSSDTSSGMNTPPENESKSSNMLLDPATYAPVFNNAQKARSDWSSATTHETTTTDDSTNSPKDDFSSVEKLKAELLHLSRKAEMSDLELNTLRKQVVKDSKRVHDLLKEIVSLKEERDAYKADYEKLKLSSKRIDELKSMNRSGFEGDPWALLDESRQELSYEKDLNANLRIQLQKTQDSNSELILAVQDLEHMLDQKDKGDSSELTSSSVSGKSCVEEGDRVREEQGQSDDDEEQKALEELVKQHSDAKDAYILEQRIMDLRSEMEMYRRDKDELEMQIEQLALDYEIMKQENHDMSQRLEQSQLQEELRLQYENSNSYVTINELNKKVEKLEQELTKRSNEYADSLVTIKKLENHVQTLEGELETQAKGFKTKLETVVSAKEEQEQIVTKTEDVLRSTREELESRIKNLQAELRKQSQETSKLLSTIKELESNIQSLEVELEKQVQAFEADLEDVTRSKVEQEKRAIKAEEALILTRWKNANTAERLQDEFKKLSQQMQSTFEANQKVASKALAEAGELRLLNHQLEESLREAKDEAQAVKDDCEALVSNLRHQISSKSEQIDRLLEDIKQKTMQVEGDEQEAGLKAELEQVKALVKERDVLILRKEMEKHKLEAQIELEKQQADKSVEELNVVRCLKEEKEMALTILQSEVETRRSECEELRKSLYEDEVEKEKLKKQVQQLKNELKKKDEVLTTMERKLKDNNGRVAAASDRTKAVPRNNKTAEINIRGSREAAGLREKIKVLEGQIKIKEAALETSANAFLEKEKDLHNKIEELELRLEELNQTSTNCCVEERLKVDGICEGILNMNPQKEAQRSHPIINQDDTSVNSSEYSRLESDRDAMLKEMESMREKNICMDNELREMQQRYSDISLKFAEVEGERQQLVMALRNLKNGRS